MSRVRQTTGKFLVLFILSNLPAAQIVSAKGAEEENLPYDENAYRIATNYHGTLLDADYKLIVLTEGSVLDLQSAMIGEIRAHAAPDLGEYFDELAKAAFEGREFDNASRSLMQNAVIAHMLLKSDEELAQALDWRREVLKVHLFSTYRVLASEIEIEQAELAEALRELNIFELLFPYTPPGQPYLDRCVANQVPIPPNTGQIEGTVPPDTPAWVYRGTVSPVFIVPWLPTTEVYTFENQDGLCIKLPRKDSTGATQLSGIICQSEATGKACFWDNISIETGQVLTGAAAESVDVIEPAPWRPPLGRYGNTADRLVLTALPERNQSATLTSGMQLTSICFIAGENSVLHGSTPLLPRLAALCFIWAAPAALPFVTTKLHIFPVFL